MTSNGPNRPAPSTAPEAGGSVRFAALLLVVGAWATATSITMAAVVRVSIASEPAVTRAADGIAARSIDFEPWCELPDQHAANRQPMARRALLEGLVADHLAREGVPRPRTVSAVLVATAIRHDVDPLLVVGLMEVESGYRTGARSTAGALGLLQVRPATAREVAEHRGLQWSGPAQLFVPEINVRLGILYLSDLLDQFEDVEHALAAYNRGPTAVSRTLSEGGAVPREFAERVSQAYQELRSEIQAELFIESEPTRLAASSPREPSFEG